MRFIIILLSVLAFESSANSQLLYFANERTILSYNISKEEIDTIWHAPFTIDDIAINQNGEIITFTKPLNEFKPDRSVGYFLVSEKKYELIPSRSDYNFDAFPSPDGQLIVFSAYIDDKWQVSLMDRKSNTISYDIFKYKDDDASQYGWESDSVLQIMTYKGAVRQNILTGRYSIIPIPNKLEDNYGLPGTKWLPLNDSLSMINAYDEGIKIESFDGMAANLFEINHGKYHTLLKGKIDVVDFFLCDNQVFIQYVDYKTKKGKVILGVYDINTGSLKTISTDSIDESFKLVGAVKD